MFSSLIKRKVRYGPVRNGGREESHPGRGEGWEETMSWGGRAQDDNILTKTVDTRIRYYLRLCHIFFFVCKS